MTNKNCIAASSSYDNFRIRKADHQYDGNNTFKKDLFVTGGDSTQNRQCSWSAVAIISLLSIPSPCKIAFFSAIMLYSFSGIAYHANKVLQLLKTKYGFCLYVYVCIVFDSQRNILSLLQIKLVTIHSMCGTIDK